MKKEIALLNLICIVVAVGLIAFAILSAISSGDFLTTDNLFITTVCLVLALMFLASPLLYLKSEGKVPTPFKRRASSQTPQLAAAGGVPIAAPASPALLDAKGRPVPPDVRSMVGRFAPQQKKDV